MTDLYNNILYWTHIYNRVLGISKNLIPNTVVYRIFTGWNDMIDFLVFHSSWLLLFGDYCPLLYRSSLQDCWLPSFLLYFHNNENYGKLLSQLLLKQRNLKTTGKFLSTLFHLAKWSLNNINIYHIWRK